MCFEWRYMTIRRLRSCRIACAWFMLLIASTIWLLSKIGICPSTTKGNLSSKALLWSLKQAPIIFTLHNNHSLYWYRYMCLHNNHSLYWYRYMCLHNSHSLYWYRYMCLHNKHSVSTCIYANRVSDCCVNTCIYTNRMSDCCVNTCIYTNKIHVFTQHSLTLLV
jgi:hypothetical protein